jgi:uncharacterized protein YycO
MKKWILCGLSSLVVWGMHSPSYAASPEIYPYVKEIVAMQPGSSQEEVIADARQVAEIEQIDVEEVLKQMQQELAADVKKGEEEMKRKLHSGSDGRRPLPTSEKGNVFYTDAYSSGVNHGHVGVYYTNKNIVESTSGVGVREIEAKSVKVYKGAVIQSVKTSEGKRRAAADWAKSRVGKDGYSYNFANNRRTSHYGNKNCSKLVWSSFILQADLDVDKDKGSGVYPRDIRDSSLTVTVKTIQ